MKRILVTLLLFAIGVFLALSAIRVVGWNSVVVVLAGFDAPILAPILLLTVVHVLISTWRWHIILHEQGVSIPFWRLVPLWAAGNAFSYLSPVVFLGGEGVRAYLLKTRYNVPLPKGSASVIVDQLIYVTSVFFVVVTSALLMLWLTGLPQMTRIITLAIGLFITLSAFVFVVYIQAFRNANFLTPLLRAFSLETTKLGVFIRHFEEEMITFLNPTSRALWGVFALSLVGQLVYIARNAAILFALGKGIAVLGAVLVMGATYLGYLIPVPGALGTQEVAQAALFSVAGFGPDFGIAFSLVFRTADLFVVLFGGIILLQSLAELLAFKVMGKLGSNNSSSTTKS
ncbi:MAG: lysylphosphatidylglycerol synthase transmembrane domain-containing protein [Candidatus Spechtbacterales bacterium]